MFTETMTLGEQLMSALGVTLLGMGIVFAVLIGLSFALDLLRMIAGEKPKKETTASQKAPKKSEGSIERVQETVIENIQNEEELVAVIAAAICAASGRRMEDLLVKSIRPIPQKTSVWGAAGRQQQMVERF